MSQSSVHRRPPQPPLVPRVKFWLESDGRSVFCTGVCQILQAVERTGSIKQAAREMGRSYRFIWGRLKQAEETLGQSLVEAHVGGKGSRRSFLTPLARELVSGFASLRQRLMEFVDEEFRSRFPSPAGRGGQRQ